MSYAHLPYLYNKPYSVVDPILDYYGQYTTPYYQYEYANYTKDRYDDYVRNKSVKELDEIKQMREKIEALAKHAKEKDMMIELEQKNLAKEKEFVFQRLNDAKRKEEIAQLEKERLEDAKRNLNLRYAAVPRRSDLYPWPYFREFYGGAIAPQPQMVHNSYMGGHGCSPFHSHDFSHDHGHGHGHGCGNGYGHGYGNDYDHGCGCGSGSYYSHNHDTHCISPHLNPRRCHQCQKEKTTYILPPISNSKGASFELTKTRRIGY